MVTSTNKLSLTNKHVINIPVDSSAKRHNMAVNLRIIGMFVAERISREVSACDGQ
jgi:hypothetical protein